MVDLSYNVGRPSNKLVYKPHEYYSYTIVISTRNHSDWSYKRTNLAISSFGGPTTCNYTYNWGASSGLHGHEINRVTGWWLTYPSEK